VRACCSKRPVLAATIVDRQLPSTSDTAIGSGCTAVAFVSSLRMNVFELLGHATAGHWPAQLRCLLWPVDCMVLLCLCDICDRLEMPA